MKKFIFTLMASLMVWSVSAQEWGVGGRIGAGFQAQGEYYFENDNYIEARFGMSWCNNGAPLMADFTALYQWNLFKMDWTPSAGEWFFDLGAGLGVGGRANYAYVGAVGCAKLGLKLNNVPLKISIDWSPLFGPEIAYAGGTSVTDFHGFGLLNMGISCVYNF